MMMDRTNNERAPLLGTRQKDELSAMQLNPGDKVGNETAYLLNSPGNAERLMKSIGEMRAGKVNVRQLLYK